MYALQKDEWYKVKSLSVNSYSKVIKWSIQICSPSLGAKYTKCSHKSKKTTGKLESIICQ